MIGEIQLPPDASWNPNGTTVAGSANGTRGTTASHLDLPRGISITDNDVLYISDTYNHRIVVIDLVSPMNNFLIKTNIGFGSGLTQFNSPQDVLARNLSIYVLERDNYRVKKLSLNGSDPTIVLEYDRSKTPVYFYVDENANIYITDDDKHRVLLFLANSKNFTIVAGSTTSGSGNNQLNKPYGIFVNRIGTIYIADHDNHRIMKWTKGASSGIRVAGDGKSGSIVTQLNQPIYVTVDIDEYVYISEAGNHRITRWAPNSSSGECIAGCAGKSGRLSNQLTNPVYIAFDSHGSLYVADQNNNRVQKFSIMQPSGKSTMNLISNRRNHSDQ